MRCHRQKKKFCLSEPDLTRSLLLVVLCLALLPSASRAGSQSLEPQPTFEWNSPGEVRLRDGRILILGSLTTSYPPGLANTVVLFDPQTRQRTRLSPSVLQQCDGTPVLLKDGRVLIVGGVQCLPFALLRAGQRTCGGLRLAQIFDPASLTFTATGDLNETRVFASAILLNNEKVLVIGGSQNFPGSSLMSCEVYDPATGIFTKTGNMHLARTHPLATLLPNGNVLIHDGDYVGNPSGGSAGVIQDEIYDPSNGSFQLVQ
jgi:hypothetical protein